MAFVKGIQKAMQPVNLQRNKCFWNKKHVGVILIVWSRWPNNSIIMA